MTNKLIIAISGASGILYSIKLLQVLKEMEIETHLVISKAAHIVIAQETDLPLKHILSLASYTYKCSDIAARISSGSFLNSGMIIIPCSMNTLGCIASSVENNLITRAASVTLKENRKLVLAIRETPLHKGYLENMLKVSQFGGIIAPLSPGFYNKPQTIECLINHSVARTLDLFDIESNLIERWDGLKR